MDLVARTKDVVMMVYMLCCGGADELRMRVETYE